MKITVVTQVWLGEYDPAEFLDGHSVAPDPCKAAHLLVTEELLLNPNASVTLTADENCSLNRLN